MENIIQLDHVKKYYESHKAVDDISFAIPRGSIFGLLGPNGAGKTTLLRIITGIFYQDEGDVIFNGKPFSASRDGLSIGYMPEERGLYKKMKVGEHILYLAQLKGMSIHDAREKTRYWISKFELQNWWNKKVGDLSKGMQQKVQFIATILHEPPLLILDEPFSGLDPLNTNIIKDEIFDLSKKGTTIIFSTHRMEQVEEICSYIVLMNKGRKILDGSIDQVKQDFKKSEFRILLAQPVNSGEISSDAFEVENADHLSLTVKLKEGHNNNEVLSYFIEHNIGIQAFHEILPSINEIFIRQVEHTSDHS